MEITIKCREKYRRASNGRPVRNGKYRTRTGPNCCNAGCPSMYKKGRRKTRKVAT